MVDKKQAQGKAAAAKPAAKKEKQEPAAAEKKPPVKRKGAGKKDDDAKDSPGFLAALRPTRRPIFFALWLVGCCWILLFHNPCDVKGKKKDCGYSGITKMECRLLGCFTKGPGPFERKTVKVKREQGAKLGLELGDRAGSAFIVRGIADGAVQKYNAELAPDAQDGAVRPGDRLVRVDSSKGREIAKATQESSAKTVVLEIQRSRLPSYLRFLHSLDDKPNMLERVLSAFGTTRFLSNLSTMIQVALPAWLISGYPVASLPAYFFTSSLVSLQLSRCCHDDTAKNAPHCYASAWAPLPQVLQKLTEETTALAKRVQSDPKAYFEWLFVFDGL
mmetsp:Transcript_50712/g.117967  ORF Transcript_50712/g.117967 Transcript_50712/m.117967 type:complete len:332 (+) Transcript_50712:83-1078(+)|eukprot:CAMPEP_0176218852 /NCGR_PEP_ID=MMETSP0121_2-20121125/18409_1 /TAXON_ID=160619 /ORGANISM="Kryptoperidinium foliaceum, Strain CCMP 1326" /LENGTH=331 /DNA_ID=CAMNT_0017558001 /DNA_START=88 /DNA_END=1083 /DNA_ORIENTATION=-